MMMGLIRGWNTFLKRKQNVITSYGMVSVIQADHRRVHEGKMYSSSGLVDYINNGVTRSLLLRPNGVDVHLRQFEWKVHKTPMQLKLLEAPYVDASSIGTEFTPENMNRTFPNSSGVQIFDNTYIDPASNGTEMDIDIISINHGGGGVTGGSPEEWLLDNTKDYVLQIINDSTEASSGSAFFARWYQDEE